VDAETYWVLGRTERVPSVSLGGEVITGIAQRTTRFAILSPERVPANTFDFTPPADAEVRTIKGINDFFVSSASSVELAVLSELTHFAPALPSDMPLDLKQGAAVHYQQPGQGGAFGIFYWGAPGRRAQLREYEQAEILDEAARAVAVGEKQGWLVADPIYGRKFSLHLADPGPGTASPGQSWPGAVELDAWGLSLDEAVTMLTSLEPYTGD
jgi:hypothetical protein